MKENQKKYIILGSLCALVLMLAVGYAAFNAVLNIKGTSNINSNWDVKITNIKKIASKGSTDKAGTPKFDDLSATFDTEFTTPGDYATYKIEITNNGSLDAVLKNIKIPKNTNNDIIFYLNKNQNNEDMAEALKQNDTLFKKGETGNVRYVYVTVLYRDYENQKTAENKTANMTITFDFEQADKAVTPTPTPQLTTVYAYHTDTKTIGTSVLTESEYKTDYNEIIQIRFLKYDIDSEGVIQNAYACYKTLIDEPVCLQGGKNSEGKSYYEEAKTTNGKSNKEILEELQPEFQANSGECVFRDEAFCGISDERVYAYSDGGVAAVDESQLLFCQVGSDGSAYCYVH